MDVRNLSLAVEATETISARVVASGLAFPEGPTMLPDGSLLVVELASGTLARIDLGDGVVTRVAHLGGSPNGAALLSDGSVLVCNNGGMAFEESHGEHHPTGLSPHYRGGSMQRVDLATGAFDVLHDSYEGHRLVGPNDVVVEADDSFWFTDQPRRRERDRDWGAVYHVSAPGVMTRVVDRLDDPNGIGLSPDGSRLYVAETNPGRVWAWDVASAGVLSTPYAGPLERMNRGGALIGRSPTMRYYDSMAVTAGGALVVGTIGDPGGLTTFDVRNGSQTFHLLEGFSEPYVTNVCFGGPDRTKAYATLSISGLVVELDWPEPGLALAN